MPTQVHCDRSAVARRMTAKVLEDGDASDAFPVTSGVKQGCVLAPTLFGMVSAAMLSDAFQDSETGISLTNRRLFNLRCLQAVTGDSNQKLSLLKTVP